MVIYLLSYLCLLAILFSFMSFVLSNEDNRLRKSISATLVIIFVAALYVLLVISVSKPKAIDVYRGKTTLEITYKNNVPIDTVVTYKDK